jgi:UDP-glucose 6-dehydrogenase
MSLAGPTRRGSRFWLSRWAMRIAVVGTGYVGLVAGACFADAGTTVTCVDVDEQKLELLRSGTVPFFEPRLEKLVRRNWPQRLDFSSNLAESIQGRVAVFIAVGTPRTDDVREAPALKLIGKLVEKGATIRATGA